MVLKLSIDQDIVTLAVKGISKAVTQMEKDAAYALRSTVTRTAAMGRKALNDALKSRLNNPVAFLYQAYFFKPATDLNNPQATILVGGGFTAGSKADYIAAITDTGEHVTSRVTKRLRREGVLRGSEYAAATPAIRRNSRGDINGGYLQKVLAGDKGLRIKKGKYRGLYEIKKTRRGGIKKIYTPSHKPRRYNPRVNVEKVLRPIIESFDVRYNEAFQKNIKRSIARTLK